MGKAREAEYESWDYFWSQWPMTPASHLTWGMHTGMALLCDAS